MTDVLSAVIVAAGLAVGALAIRTGLELLAHKIERAAAALEVANTIASLDQGAPSVVHVGSIRDFRRGWEDRVDDVPVDTVLDFRRRRSTPPMPTEETLTDG